MSLQRSFLIFGVRLVKIDVVGLQSGPGISADRKCVFESPLRAVAHVQAGFGRNQHTVALAALLSAICDHGFGFAAVIPWNPVE